jgi:hypothetical protein
MKIKWSFLWNSFGIGFVMSSILCFCCLMQVSRSMKFLILLKELIELNLFSGQLVIWIVV